MSERTDPELESFVTRRLVSGVDLLPVPAGVRRLPPRAVPGRQEDLRFVLAVAFALFAIVLLWAPASQAVADAAKLLQRSIIGAAYVGYYQVEERDSNGMIVYREMFASGRLPGSPAAPGVSHPDADLIGHTRWWSDDGEHMVVWSGPRILLGDRSGRLREIANVGPEHVVVSAYWLGTGDIYAVLDATTRDPSRRWVSIVNVDRGAGRPRLLPSRVTSAAHLTEPSPDGRWRPIARGPGPCGEASGLYHLDEDRIVDVVDIAGRPLTALDWVRDGRLLSAFCRPAEGTMELFLSSPGTAPTAVLATVPWAAGSAMPMVDRPRGRILIAPRGGPEATTLIALDLDGHRAELGRVPQLTADPSASTRMLTLSRDGRYLSFRLDFRRDPSLDRAGLIDLATGQVTFACAAGCVRLSLR